MEILFLCVILGLIPAMIAKGKGRSVLGWWIFGMLLFIIALPASIFASDLNKKVREKTTKEATKRKNGTLRKCPYCAEMIQREAIKCRFCHEAVLPVTIEKREFETQKSCEKKISSKSQNIMTAKQAGSSGNFFSRHKVLTGLVGVVLLIMGVSIVKQKPVDVPSSRDERNATATVASASDHKEVEPTDVTSEDYEDYCYTMWNRYRIKYDKTWDIDFKNKQDEWKEKWAKVREKRLYAKVRTIPVKQYQLNAGVYKELSMLNPDKQEYQEKYKYYSQRANKHWVEPPLIPRSTSGDKGRYYLVSAKALGADRVAIVKRVGVYDTLYTKTQINCSRRKYKVLGEGSGIESISVTPGKWTSLVPGSSKSDLVNFVCP